MNDQQGPMAAYIRETPSLEQNYPSVLAKAREFDTAFAALESALRHMITANEDHRVDGRNSLKERLEARAEADAALALAEGVRNG